VRPRQLRWLVALVALGVAGSAFWAGPGAATQAMKVKCGMPTTPPNAVHITPWVAKDQGFFAEEGLDVEIPTFEGGLYVIRNVVSGALDAGAGAGATIAVSAARKAGVKAIYSLAPRFASTMTVRSNIRSLEDLRGKKLGVQEIGGFADVPPLLAGAIDTEILHVDQMLQARRKEPSLRPLVKFWELEPNQLFLVVVAPERKLAAEPAKYQALVRALAKANRFMYANRGRAVEIAAKYTQMPRDIVEEAYEELVRGRVWAQNDGLPREKVEYTINRMVEVGNIKPEERPRYEDYVAVSLVQEALHSLTRVPEYD